MPKKNQVGLYLGDVSDIRLALTESREAGFDYICCGLVSDDYRQKTFTGVVNDATKPFSWFDMSLSSQDWNQAVVGILSDLHLFTESSNIRLRQKACDLIVKEIDYTQHLSLLSAIVNLPESGTDTANLCRLLNAKLSNDGVNHSSINLWVRIPMVHPTTNKIMNGDSNGELDVDDDENPSRSSWNTWNKFRTAVNPERRIQPVLDLPLDLPGNEEIKRWLGEPVRAICISEEMFISNQKGFPILPKRTQAIVKDFFDIGAHVIINCAKNKVPGDYVHCKQYIEYLYGAKQKDWEEDPVIKYTKGYEDYLQSPLQPLMDNLEANTYEVFERDPTKYSLYQNAISKALVYKIPEEEKETKTIGDGGWGWQGPIVRNCLTAADNVGRKIKLYAVEKNTNAVCTLLHLKEHIWGDRVTVVSCDMREWEPEEKADILISELLGSFGDNELSPECLDGAQKFLKEDGIMIPQSYKSFISPVMTSRLHCDVRSFFDHNKHSLSHVVTPYVVYMKNYYEIDRPQPLFTFVHPKQEVRERNDRYAVLDFTAKQDCCMHGIAGYFQSELFGDVLMSIHPDTHSDGMFSWFPIFFPIRDPISDGLTSYPWSQGKSLIWDVTVVDTVANSYVSVTSDKSGSAADQAERGKHNIYIDLKEQYHFTPLAFETFGSIGPETEVFLKKLGKLMKRSTGEPRSLDFLLQRISIAIQRGNATSIRN